MPGPPAVAAVMMCAASPKHPVDRSRHRRLARVTDGTGPYPRTGIAPGDGARRRGARRAAFPGIDRKGNSCTTARCPCRMPGRSTGMSALGVSRCDGGDARDGVHGRSASPRARCNRIKRGSAGGAVSDSPARCGDRPPPEQAMRHRVGREGAVAGDMRPRDTPDCSAVPQSRGTPGPATASCPAGSLRVARDARRTVLSGLSVTGVPTDLTIVHFEFSDMLRKHSRRCTPERSRHTRTWMN